MSWRTLTTQDVLSEFTLSEAAALRQLQGSGSGSGQPFANIDVIVAHAIDEVRGFISAGGYTVDPILDNTIPQSLFSDAIALARWRVLIAVPSLRQLQTDERKLAYQDALKKLFMIADTKFAVEPPTPGANPDTGMWNAENKLIMKTHPVPRPGQQFTPQTNTYANPVAPADIPNDPPPPAP